VSFFIFYFAECHYASNLYAEYRILFIIMLNVMMMIVIMLSVIMLSVVFYLL
jgi:hypothetical protein